MKKTKISLLRDNKPLCFLFRPTTLEPGSTPLLPHATSSFTQLLLTFQVLTSKHNTTAHFLMATLSPPFTHFFTVPRTTSTHPNTFLIRSSHSFTRLPRRRFAPVFVAATSIKVRPLSMHINCSTKCHNHNWLCLTYILFVSGKPWSHS